MVFRCLVLSTAVTQLDDQKQSTEEQQDLLHNRQKHGSVDFIHIFRLCMLM